MKFLCFTTRTVYLCVSCKCKLLCLRRVMRADLLNSIKRPSKPVEPDLGSPVIFQLFRICIRDYKVRMKLFSGPRLKFSVYKLCRPRFRVINRDQTLRKLSIYQNPFNVVFNSQFLSIRNFQNVYLRQLLRFSRNLH